MACSRCSPVSGCGCAVIAGNNVTVTGFGTLVSPWVINASDVPCARVQACETITTIVDNGNGSFTYTNEAATPVTISEVPFAAVASGAVTITPGGLIGHAPTIGVSCAAIQACVVFPPEVTWTGTPSGLVTITPGGPFGHNPTIGVSCADVQACVGPETPWIGTQSGLVTITPGGPFGHSPTIDVSCAAVQACVAPTITGWNGQSASNPCGTSSWVGGNIPNGGNLIFVAGAGINIYGGGVGAIGFEVRTTGGAWPFPCADTNGAPIYCTADGLRTVPEHTSVQFGRPCSVTAGVTTAAGPVSVLTAVANGANNPSPCRTMNFINQYGYGAQIGNNPGLFGVSLAFNIAGSPGYNGTFVYGGYDPTAAGALTPLGRDFQVQSTNWDVFTVGPGAAFAITITSAVTATTGAGLAQALACISMFGVTI